MKKVNQQLKRLKILIPDERNDELLNELLRRSEDAIRARRRMAPELPLEEKYITLQIEIAVFLYNKLGAEGEKTHTENGVARTYENSHIPDSLLNQITPLGQILK